MNTPWTMAVMTVMAGGPDVTMSDDAPQMKYVSLHGGTLPDLRCSLGALIEWLQSLMDKVPAEYRDAAQFCMIDADYEYGTSAGLDISYLCPETEEEAVARKNEKTIAVDLDRLAELETLSRLKAKYPEAG